MQSLQYNILNNVLFLNKKLHTFGINLHCVLSVIYTTKAMTPFCMTPFKKTNKVFIKNILIIIKLYVYKSRENKHKQKQPHRCNAKRKKG